MSLHLEQVFVFVFLYDNFDFTSLSGVERVQLWPLGQWGSFVRSALGPGGSPGWPLGERGRVESGGSHHQFIIEFLLRVMKKTWLLPPERTDAKNTWSERILQVLSSHFLNNCRSQIKVANTLFF